MTGGTEKAQKGIAKAWKKCIRRLEVGLINNDLFEYKKVLNKTTAKFKKAKLSLILNKTW